MAPKDNQRLLLKYEIGRAGGIPIQELIKVLEIYNEREMDDRWEYELARLYHEAGDGEKCAEACDQVRVKRHNVSHGKKRGDTRHDLCSDSRAVFFYFKERLDLCKKRRHNISP